MSIVQLHVHLTWARTLKHQHRSLSQVRWMAWNMRDQRGRSASRNSNNIFFYRCIYKWLYVMFFVAISIIDGFKTFTTAKYTHRAMAFNLPFGIITYVVIRCVRANCLFFFSRSFRLLCEYDRAVTSTCARYLILN